MKLYAVNGSLAAIKANVASSYASKSLQILNLTSEIQAQLGPLSESFDVFLLSPKGLLAGEKAVLAYIAESTPEIGLNGQNWYESVAVLSFLDLQAKLETVMKLDETSAPGDLNEAKKLLKAFEETLLYNTYLLGHHVTIADVAAAVVLKESISQNKMDDAFLQYFPCIQRWLNTITAQKQFVSVTKKDAGKKKAVVTQKAKEESQAPADKKADVEEEQGKEEEVAVELPILEKWKKLFSNSKNLKGEAMPWFWENFDLSTSHSIWFMKYNKLPTECKMDFLTCNLMNGFMQRVDDKMRNESFGVIMVVGDDGDFDIQGVWLFAGQEIPVLLQQHPSFEYNEFVKLSPTSDSDKKLVTDHWCETESIDNRTVVLIKNWK